MKILKQLRDAATPSTKLVILEMIMRHACHDDTEDNATGITSSVSIEAPNPLLPNWGAVNDIIYILDMVVRVLSHFPLRVLNIEMTDVDHVQLTRKDDPTI